MSGTSDIKKEALTNTGAEHPKMNGSLPDGGTPFVINLASFAEGFKRDDSIILKDFPDGMLSEDQLQIKGRVQAADVQKEHDVIAKESRDQLDQSQVSRDRSYKQLLEQGNTAKTHDSEETLIFVTEPEQELDKPVLKR